MLWPTAAERILASRSIDVFSHERGVREGVDPEAIHDMRVALRRLQAALRLFKVCYPPKRLRRYRRQLRTLLQALGAVRDQDVIIGALALHAEASAGPVKEGLARVMTQRRTAQQQERAKSLRLLDKLQKGNFSQSLLSFVRGARGFKRVASQRQFGPEVVGIAAKALSSWNGRRREVQAQGDSETLHQMRIAIKHLRYTMELCRLANGHQYQGCVERLAEMQRVLGDIHDADVLVECLAESLPCAPIAAIRGLADIMTVIRQKREDLIRCFFRMISSRNLGPLKLAPGGPAPARRSDPRQMKQALHRTKVVAGRVR